MSRMCTFCSGPPVYICFSQTERAKVRQGQCGVQKVAIKEVTGSTQDIDLMAIRNANIIQFYHHYGNMQVMDFADRGTLADAIEDIGDRREDIAKQISGGLEYLQSLNFIHRKIRTSNILLTWNFDAKIAGFGSDDVDFIKKWIAPELLEDPTRYSFQSDIYALGMVMDEMGEGSADYMQWMVHCQHWEPTSRPLKCPILQAPSEDLEECKTKEERLQRLKSKARQGNGVVANHLGHMYRTGTKVVENEKEALEWYLLAANMNCAEAQCTMGVHYHDIDHDAAEMWYLKAEKQGNQRTWSNLGDLMIAQRRYIKAAEWYRKAASVNDASAQYSLGEMYFQGFILKDDTLALEWYSKAAAQGYADAEASLGYMYHHGRGTKSNYEEAEKWYLRAIEQGHLEAQRSLEEMRKDKAAWDWNQEILRTMVSVDGDGECLDPTKFALMIEKLNECSLGPMDYFQNDTEKSRKDESEVTCLPLYKMN